MNVLLVEPFGHREGHPAFTSRRLSYALVEAGARVTLLTFMGLLDDWARSKKMVEHISVFPRTRMALRLEAAPNRFPIGRSILKILETAVTLSRAAWLNRNGRYDVIHVLDAEPVFFVCLGLAFFSKGRSVVTTVYNPPPPHRKWRGSYTVWRLRPQILADAARYLVRTMVQNHLFVALRTALYRRAMEKNPTLFVCETTGIQQSYETYMNGIFQGRFVHIPLGVEEPVPRLPREKARSALGLPEDKRILLSFGTNHEGKDFEVIFQALRGLSEDLVFVQAGKLTTTDEVSDPQRLAERYGCAEKTIVRAAFIPEEEKPLYFFAADAVVLSYRKDFIQWGSILNDAARCSTPVIASDVGQLGQFVKRYHLGMTFVPEDADSLRQAILTFLHLPEEERERLGANCKAYAEQFPWAENARRHLEVFQRVRRA
jgi:glycosyltransferase involved in cell wall biosynthesis